MGHADNHHPLVRAPQAWQEATMPGPTPRTSLAGGFPIAAGVLLGCILGFVAGQPTVGFLIGLALGIAAALVLARRS